MKEGFLAIVFIGIVVGASWFGSHWQERQDEAADTRPSIDTLKQSAVLSSGSAQSGIPQEDASPEIVSVPTIPQSDKVEDKGKLAVTVLNGGAAKGSAVKGQTLLKEAGYTQAKNGNTVGNYVGTSVYYLDGFAANAEQIKQALSKEYPGAQIKQADPKKEEGSASIVVILGR